MTESIKLKRMLSVIRRKKNQKQNKPSRKIIKENSRANLILNSSKKNQIKEKMGRIIKKEKKRINSTLNLIKKRDKNSKVIVNQRKNLTIKEINKNKTSLNKNNIKRANAFKYLELLLLF